jgi:P27 family predicted phage terminase small subunit
MASGGYRTNSGRKKKPAMLKIAEGNKGKREIQVLELGPTAAVLPSTPPEYLSEKAKEIYTNVYKWLESIDCLKGILPYNLQEYAFCKARWMECEEMNTSHGLLMKDDKGRPIASPYVQLAQMYLRQTNEVWAKIYVVISESKLSKYPDSNPNDDILENLFRGKKS